MGVSLLMKTYSFSRLAAVLIGGLFLASSASAASPRPSEAEVVRMRLELDRPLLPITGAERAVLRVSLEGAKRPRLQVRPPVNLCLVIDRSGSMSGEKIRRAKEAAIEAVRRLDPDDAFSLVVYNSGVETLIPARRIGNRAGVESTIESIFASGGTALHGGVVRGASELRVFTEDPRYVHRMILLSDGQANVGPSTPAELGRLGANLLREGISVTTVGVGLDFNEDLMTQLAQRSDGNTYFVESSRDLAGIFNAELGDVLSVVARRVVVKIEFSEGVRPLGFVGRDGSIRGQEAELALNQLYGGQDKFALIEVEVSPAKAGSERELARAQLQYDDPLVQREVKLQAQANVRFSNNDREIIASANRSVQTDYARNVTAVAKEAAIVLVDAQKQEEAASQFRARNAELASMAKLYGNTAVERLVEDNGRAADQLEREGLNKATRKMYKATSAQTINQQSTSNVSP